MWHHYVENSISIKKHVLKLAYCQPTPERHVYLKKKIIYIITVFKWKLWRFSLELGLTFYLLILFCFFFCRLSIIHSGSIQSFDRLILSWCTLATRTGSKELYVNVNEMYAPDPWQWAIRPWIISSREKRTGNAYVNRDPPDKSIVPIQRFIIIFYFFRRF